MQLEIRQDHFFNLNHFFRVLFATQIACAPFQIDRTREVEEKKNNSIRTCPNKKYVRKSNLSSDKRNAHRPTCVLCMCVCVGGCLSPFIAWVSLADTKLKLNFVISRQNFNADRVPCAATFEKPEVSDVGWLTMSLHV